MDDTDLPAARNGSDQFDRLVTTMDRLRSPGGCPWDAEQTHESLIPYAVEETYELVEAIESGDRDHMLEELGDLLLQVVFHARLAQERATAPFDIEDVARGITDKLIARHPHVFTDLEVENMAELESNWERIKQREKQRERLLDGIPIALPALSRVGKVWSRANRVGFEALLVDPRTADGGHVPSPESITESPTSEAIEAQEPTGTAMLSADVLTSATTSERALGQTLLDLALAAKRRGLDPEAALRTVLRTRESALETAYSEQQERVSTSGGG